MEKIGQNGKIRVNEISIISFVGLVRFYMGISYNCDLEFLIFLHSNQYFVDGSKAQKD